MDIAVFNPTNGIAIELRILKFALELLGPADFQRQVPANQNADPFAGRYAVDRGPKRFAVLIQPPGFWTLAIFGLFAYHAFYFLALRLAPAAEANLINYLWPLLIVLLSGPLGLGAVGIWAGLSIGTTATAAGLWVYLRRRDFAQAMAPQAL